jgi:hypothetical protein
MDGEKNVNERYTNGQFWLTIIAIIGHPLELNK